MTGTKQELSVYVEDPYEDEAIPRGKQFWEKKSAGIWYTRTSGIWQTVWLEPVNIVHMEHLKLSTDIDQGTLLIDAEFSDAYYGLVLQTEITFQGQLVTSDSYSITERQCFHRTIHITGDKIFHGHVHDAKRLWSPENPALYDITFIIKDESHIYDEVKSYFGMRKIHTENGMTYLNNRPYYFKLILDQGYFEDGICFCLYR